MSDFELFVGRTKLTQFENGWVKRELDTIADSFEFQYADLRTNLNEGSPILPGDAIYIKLCGETLLTGYVDDTSVQYTADTLQLTARGRSKTGDLVDCSAIRQNGRWRDTSLLQIVTDLCKPFGIDVEVNVTGIEKFKRFAIEPGESAADAIQRACRLRAVWATCTVDGNVLITRAATGDRASIGLEYGKNIISGERFDSWAQRHSQYFLKGQVPSDDQLAGRAATQLSSEDIFDEGVDRYRPLLLVSTGADRKGDLKRRAQWERNRRAGSGERWLYRVDGYGYDVERYVGQFKSKRRAAYRLWLPNQLVKVSDPRLEAGGELLISSVSYRWQAEGDDGGRTTDLGLNRQEAFDLQDYPVKRKRRRPDDFDPFDRPQGLYTPYRRLPPVNPRESELEAITIKPQGPPLLPPYRP